MMHYRDRMYCTFYRECAKGAGCSRALTDAVANHANSIGMYISQFVTEPECYEEGEDATEKEIQSHLTPTASG